MTTGRTELDAAPLPAWSAVRIATSRPALQSGPAKTSCIRCWNHASAVPSEQSCASLQRLGTTNPTFGSVPAATSPEKLLKGTSKPVQPVRSAGGVKYSQGLCLTAYRLVPFMSQGVDADSA